MIFGGDLWSIGPVLVLLAAVYGICLGWPSPGPGVALFWEEEVPPDEEEMTVESVAGTAVSDVPMEISIYLGDDCSIDGANQIIVD